MTVYTSEQHEVLEDVADATIRNATTLLVAGFPVTTVEGYLSRRVERYPGLGLTRHECHGPHCENLTDTPVVDEQQAAWLREQALTFCSEDCLTNAAEAYWTGRAS